MIENLYTPGCIRTVSGKYINPCDPDPSLICIEDIAHSLSMQCRFGGHLPVFYSVAQHCVHVSQDIPGAFSLQALLHDASEAYLLDFPKPIKMKVPEYQKIENKLLRTILVKFRCWHLGIYEPVHHIDKVWLEKEWEQLMLGNIDPVNPIRPWPQQEAKDRFLDRFQFLMQKEK